MLLISKDRGSTIWIIWTKSWNWDRASITSKKQTKTQNINTVQSLLTSVHMHRTQTENTNTLFSIWVMQCLIMPVESYIFLAFVDTTENRLSETWNCLQRQNTSHTNKQIVASIKARASYVHELCKTLLCLKHNFNLCFLY